jgi:hypothetical protein
LKLHVVYRVYGGENQKVRPSFYSKRNSLASALQAAERAEADVVVLADGPIPQDLRELAVKKAHVVDLPGGPVGLRRSFMAGLKYPDVAEWPDDDLVYFCEDDYLHEPDALVEMCSAGEKLCAADYFALYAAIPGDPAVSTDMAYSAPAYWRSEADYTVGDTCWVHVPNTTSTFGARIGTLRRDMGIHRQALIPYRTRLLDYEEFLVVQGRFPYSLNEIFLDHPYARFRTGFKALAANTLLTPFRAAYQLRALTRRRNPHLLYAASPNLASHMETDFLAPGTDWSLVAKRADEWADGL